MRCSKWPRWKRWPFLAVMYLPLMLNALVHETAKFFVEFNRQYAELWSQP